MNCFRVTPRGVESEVNVPTVDGPSDAAEASDELLILRLRHREPGDEGQLIERPLIRKAVGQEVSPDSSFAAAVAGYGMLLHDSEYEGSLTPGAVRRLAKRGRGGVPDGTRAGFISLVEAARGVLAGNPSAEGDKSSQ